MVATLSRWRAGVQIPSDSLLTLNKLRFLPLLYGMEKKICSVCREEKPLDAFCKHKARKDGRQSYCKMCKKRIDARYYRLNKADQLARNSKWKRNMREELDVVKAEIGCKYCPETDPCCLDFHHRVPTEKEYSVSRLIAIQNKQQIYAELEKCDVVCSNCHRKLHAGRELPPRC